ncbi:Nramp family divalent metal transporter [Symmachiella macrocystis]|nr:Nramp family divalent metal transporter [Symmachiella macrocystis]
MSDATNPPPDELVPDEVIPHRTLPPLRYRDMPRPISWKKMIGPSIMLAGLSLGSGEFVMWPYIVYKAGFIFFWACVLGVITQYFLNMEIERWTLVTGESAITGFCRLSRIWVPVMLLMNILPWAWPGWATGAGTMLSWSIYGPVIRAEAEFADVSNAEVPPGLTQLAAISYGETGKGSGLLTWSGPMTVEQQEQLAAASNAPQFQQAVDEVFSKITNKEGVDYDARYVPYLGIAGLFIVGAILTAGPVVYNTVERIQTILVGLIFVTAIGLGIMIIKPYAIEQMLTGAMSFGQMPAESADLGTMALLGALAFAGAGGTMNLGQSNFIKDKGYGMGQYIGRITSPLTGQEEAISDVGYHFKHTDENMARWRHWWRAAGIEHFFSFFLTCLICLMLLTLISYSLFYDADGNPVAGTESYGKGLGFVWGQAELIGTQLGGGVKYAFLLMGIAILLTTELGVLDATARISTDIVKVNLLRDNENWSASRLYFLFLWGEIILGSCILLYGTIDPSFKEPLFLLKTSAAMNGGVMMIYSVLLLYLNNKILSRSLSMTPLRFVAIIWSCAFFGYFTIQALQLSVLPYLFD